MSVSISASCQCTSSVPPINANQCHLSVLAISATYQCHLTAPVSAHISASQCRLSVPPISAIYQCCLSMPISDACQCPSVPPTSASSSVPISAAYQCPSLQPH
ncbi:unnamed protein product [Staurois parvus]|uniref:Uncharacterized protein n=1 Tax=Staurois parvus TaxID=386267 RepID=A0ABN9CMB5_9NEOB|nr:unnamed protein product [Staurois parvus]